VHERLLREASEHARVVTRLDAERAWFKAVIDRCPVGIIVIEGRHGERSVVNRKAEELMGHALPSPATVQDFAGEVCAADGKPLPTPEWPGLRALRGKTIVAQELLICRRDGRRVPVLVSAGPLLDTEGNTAGAVVAADDITAMKELERMREEWTSIVAHDLRQPITVISAYASALTRQLQGPEFAEPQRRAADHILASARQISRMIADLLDISRLQARRLQLDRREVDLVALVRVVVERTAEVTQGRRVMVEIQGEIPRVDADPGRVEQVLGNLLSNAAKYSYPGSDLRLALASRGEFVEVAVTNQGHGIAPEDAARLFERFQRTEQGRRPGASSVGLGLYIAKGIVEAHGGRIWVQSVPGWETTFFFTLPACRRSG
jgi:signal transduction histidine kinase